MQEIAINNSNIIAREELDVQITTAKRFPRPEPKAFLNEAIMMATIDEETAEGSFYALKRKGKDGKITEIKGPSVRLAEIVTYCWGNLHFGTRIEKNDGRFITAKGAAWDLERNVKGEAEVARRITYSNGGTFNEDMQVVTGNAAAAIAFRNAIFKVVPRVYVNKIYDAAIRAAVGDQKTLTTKRAKVMDRFLKMGIEKEKILTYLGKENELAIDLGDLEILIGIGTSIKEGILNIDNAFNLDAIEKGGKAAALDAMLDEDEVTN